MFKKDFNNSLILLLINLSKTPFYFFLIHTYISYFTVAMSVSSNYTEDNIRSLDWKEHIRMRPGMYIGKLGDGSSPDDGIYILIKRSLR